MPTELDPVRLAQRQQELDRLRMARFPELAQRKRERMLASPFAFLRGSAPLFYEMLAAQPSLAAGPEGEGWLVGDAHIENFGAYRTRSRESEDADKKQPCFDLNDFDDAVSGPWRWDVLRLMTSVLLASHELATPALRALELAASLLSAYVATACNGAALPPAPGAVQTLLEQVRERSKRQFLDARTSGEGERRRFLRGPRYAELTPEIRARVGPAFEAYLESVAPDERPNPSERAIIDTAFRIAGTGSLGALRIAVLTLGKSEASARIFDLKEMSQASAAPLLPAATLAPAARALAACRACLPQPPRMLGCTTLGEASLFGRRLLPQEDRLELGRLPRAEVEPLLRHLGALLGRAHARGASAPAKPWTAAAQSRLLEQAATLAGLHIATHYAYCLALR